nr:hypothetical protein [Tanacetum cinerariifolium]
MTVMDQTGEAVVTTTAAATTTTLATTTGISVMGMTKETGVSSPTDLSILVFSSPGVPLRATPTRFALRVDADTQESVVELLGGRCVFPTFPIVLRPFKTLCFFNYALMIRQDYDITSSLRRGALQ